MALPGFMHTFVRRLTDLEERVAALEGQGTPAPYYEPEPDRVEEAAEATD